MAKTVSKRDPPAGLAGNLQCKGVFMAPEKSATAGNEAESLSEKIRRVTAEQVSIAEYNPAWPALFEQLRMEIFSLLPEGYFLRFEHFGSTAVPGLAAKPVLDVAAEVRSLAEARLRLPGIFEPRGDDYFWRPSGPGTEGPWYCWLILRHPDRSRRAHIHILEPGSRWIRERLAFRDYLRLHPETAAEYACLKQQLATQHPQDRVAYTAAKSDFIGRITALALFAQPCHPREKP